MISIKLIILSNLTLYAVILGVNNHCDKLGLNFYKTIGCKPSGILNDCPTYDNCIYERPVGQCTYRGENISVGMFVDDYMDIPTCQTECYCDVVNKKGKFIKCKSESCIDTNLNLLREENKNCFLKYSLDKCCPDLTCNDKPPIACKVDNLEYKEGSIINLKSKCVSCVCTRDFNINLNNSTKLLNSTYCKPTYCDTELFYAGHIERNCAPVYKITNNSDALCCPSMFICPSKSDVIRNRITHTGRGCRYGKRKLGLGSVLTRKYNRFNTKMINCKCISPPLMTCTMFDD